MSDTSHEEKDDGKKKHKLPDPKNLKIAKDAVTGKDVYIEDAHAHHEDGFWKSLRKSLWKNVWVRAICYALMLLAIGCFIVAPEILGWVFGFMLGRLHDMFARALGSIGADLVMGGLALFLAYKGLKALTEYVKGWKIFGGGKSKGDHGHAKAH